MAVTRLLPCIAESLTVDCNPSWISSVGQRSRFPANATIEPIETASECVRLCYDALYDDTSLDCAGAQFNAETKMCQLLDSTASRNPEDQIGWIHFRFYCPCMY